MARESIKAPKSGVTTRLAARPAVASHPQATVPAGAPSWRLAACTNSGGKSAVMQTNAKAELAQSYQHHAHCRGLSLPTGKG